MQRLTNEKDEIESERRRLLESVVGLEQRLNDKERDLELKDVKIESLENIIQKREQQNEYKFHSSKLEDKLS
jgi:hypothetical protein